MEEEGQTTEPTKTTKEPALCEECKLNPSKYKCPGCSIRSCSLPCVKAHKQRTECTGKRYQTKFVPISQFDDNLILSDYNLLEDVKRVADSAQRRRVKLCGYHYFKPPVHLRSLKGAANHRRTKLLFLPSGMSKRERNQSRYDQRKKVISWTIEWRFHSTDVILLDHGINDNMTLGSIIQNHLKPGPWNHRLKKFCEEQLDCLKFFTRKYPKGARSPFRELDMKAPISQQLANLVILEYPVIYVFLPSHSYDFEVVKDAKPYPHKPDHKAHISSDHPSPKGVPFKEEEIEEDDSSSDPHVLDFMQHVKADQRFQPPHQGRTETELNNDIGIHTTEDSKTTCSYDSKNLVISEGMDFEFDQGLLDAYSDLIADINPDDFLDLGGFVGEEDHLDLSALLEEEEVSALLEEEEVSALLEEEEELEDGEIPTF